MCVCVSRSLWGHLCLTPALSLIICSPVFTRGQAQAITTHVSLCQGEKNPHSPLFFFFSPSPTNNIPTGMPDKALSTDDRLTAQSDTAAIWRPGCMSITVVWGGYTVCYCSSSRHDETLFVNWFDCYKLGIIYLPQTSKKKCPAHRLFTLSGWRNKWNH